MSILDAFSGRWFVSGSCGLLIDCNGGTADIGRPGTESRGSHRHGLARPAQRLRLVAAADDDRFRADRELGLVNVGDVVRTMPQNTPFFTETNVGIGNFNVGAQLANLRGLNPFFGTRTLTLVDTRRVVPNTEGGAVDLTLIPSMLVERTEVVTGGASAQYGSDAIAGVVNVILDKDLEGFKAQVDYGQTTESDGERHARVVRLRHGLRRRRTAATCSRASSTNSRTPSGLARTTATGAPNAGASAPMAPGTSPAGVGNGLPNFVVAPNGVLPTPDTGVVPRRRRRAQQQFNADGRRSRRSIPGCSRRRVRDAHRRRRHAARRTASSNVRPEVERYSVLGARELRLQRLGSRWFAEVAYSQQRRVGTRRTAGSAPIAGHAHCADNAFLSPAVRAARGPTGGQLARNLHAGQLSMRSTRPRTRRALRHGARAASFGSKWNWDVYYQHGKNENHQRLFNNMVGGLRCSCAVRTTTSSAGRSTPCARIRRIRRARSSAARRCPVRRSVANAAGCVPLNHLRQRQRRSRGDRLRVPHAQGGQRVRAERASASISAADLAEGWAGPIARRLRGRVASRTKYRDDARLAEPALVQDRTSLTWGLDRGGEIDVHGSLRRGPSADRRRSFQTELRGARDAT